MSYFKSVNLGDVKPSKLQLFWWAICDEIPYGWKMFYWNKVRSIFVPQHSRLRKVIPRVWQDKTELIPLWLYELVIDYVEAEKGLECWEYQGEEHPCKKEAGTLWEVYNFAKTGRKELIERTNEAYPPIKTENIEEWLKDINNPDRPPYEVEYAEVIRLEKLLKETDDKYLTWIVVNREMFWT